MNWYVNETTCIFTELRYKLLDRQAKSLRALKRFHEAGEVYTQLMESLDHAKLDETKLAEWKREVEKAMAAWATFCMKGSWFWSEQDR